MNFQLMLDRFDIRRLHMDDAQDIFKIYQHNPQYFKAMKDVPTPEGVMDDLRALPPNKTYGDKYYLGFYENKNLVAVMDLILGFPNKTTAFIGLFMVDRAWQGEGIGTLIIVQTLSYLKELGFDACRLGYVKNNLQSKSFWDKNGFVPTGVVSEQEKYTIVLMEKKL